MTRGQKLRIEAMIERLERQIFGSHMTEPQSSSKRAAMRRDIEALQAALEAVK